MRTIRWTALLAAGVLVLSCGDSNPAEPPPAPDPIPGWLGIRLQSPNTDDGGILLTVSGGEIYSVRSTHPDLFVSPPGTPVRRIIVGGELTSGGLLVEIMVPDVQSAADYTATVEQAAARNTYEQRGVSAYSLVVEQ